MVRGGQGPDAGSATGVRRGGAFSCRAPRTARSWGVSRDAVTARRPTIDPRAELSQRAAATPAHMSTLEAILARMTARPTEKDVAEAERLQKVMAGAD